MILERTSEITDTKNLGDYDDQSLTIETRGNLLRISGDIDLYVASEFRSAGEKHISGVADPVIDLTGVAFLDSAGLAALLTIARLARTQDKPLLVRAVGNPRRVLRITGVDRMMTVEG